jgi:hypothetical protein
MGVLVGTGARGAASEPVGRRLRLSVMGWGAGVGLGAAVAAFDRTFGVWWAMPLLAAAGVAVVWPGKPALGGLASGLALIALTGLPAFGRQPPAVSMLLGVLALLAGAAAWAGDGARRGRAPLGDPALCGGGAGQAAAGASAGIPVAFGAVALFASLSGAGVFAAVWLGALQIVPWIEVALSLAQASVALGVTNVVAAGRGRAGRPGRVLAAWGPLALALAALAPLVWLLFLTP